MSQPDLSKIIDKYLVLGETSIPGVKGPLPGGERPQQRLTLGFPEDSCFPIIDETATSLAKKRECLELLFRRFADDVLDEARVRSEDP